MTALYADTHPKMEAIQIELWRQASPTQKMNMLAQLNVSARTLAMTGLRAQYPQATEAELRRKLADLLLVRNWCEKCTEKSAMQNEPIEVSFMVTFLPTCDPKPHQVTNFWQSGVVC